MSFVLAPESMLRDRYVIQKVIQNTQSERIYLAEDQAQYCEECLVRELTSNDIDSANKTGERFQGKFGSFASLEHPQLQQMKDFFWEGERLFIVQSYVEGKSYQEQYQACQSFREVEAVKFLKQLLPVLSYIHSQNVIHQGISPNNIVLRIHDQKPVLTNPGILNEIRDCLGVMSSEPKFSNMVLSDSHLISDKPFYDIYSLAATTLVLLTGQEPESLLDKASGKWNWDDWILLSDEFTNVLNQMLSNQDAGANTILQALDSMSSASKSPPTYTHLPSTSRPALLIASQRELRTFRAGSNRNWMIAIGVGGLLTLVGVGSVLFVRGRSEPEQFSAQPSTVSPNDIGTPNISPSDPLVSPTIVPTPPQATAFTEKMAVNLIQEWLRAKSEAFAPPFSLDVINQYTTGKYREDRLGAVNWLKNNNGRYEFRSPTAQSTGRFSLTGQQAALTVRVTEDRTLYVNGRADPQNSGATTSTYRFILQLESGKWKIAKAEELNQ